MLKTGIIGLGQAGKLHTNVHNQMGIVQVIAGMDINHSQAIKWGNESNVDKIYSDYLEMIHEEKLDIVDICTFSPSHCKIVSRIAEQGLIKSIICEKPMAYTLGEADTMIAACDANNIKLFVNIQRRYSEHHQRTKKSIDNGDIGELKEIHISMYEDFFDYGPHFLDVMMMYCGDVDSVLGQIGCMPDEKSGKGYYPVMPVIGSFKFKNGCRGFVETITQKGTFRLVGEKAEIVLKLDDGTSGWSEAFKLMINDVINNTNISPSTALNGRKNLELILSVYESSRQSKEIMLPLALSENPLDLMCYEEQPTIISKSMPLESGISNQLKILTDVLESECFEVGEHSEAMEHFLKVLFAFACSAKNCVVELGTGMFNSTMTLGLGCKITGANFFSIDNQEKETEGEAKLCKYSIDCNFVQQDSIIAGEKWDGYPIDLLYIDTSHTYEQTLGELETWEKNVQIGGFIILHDTSSHDDVAAAIYTFTHASPSWVFLNIPIAAGLGILWKTNTEDSDVLDTGLNRLNNFITALISITKHGDFTAKEVDEVRATAGNNTRKFNLSLPTKKGKFLIGFDGAYTSQNGIYPSRGRYALYMAEALKSAGHTVHLYNPNNVWDYSTSLVVKIDFDSYDRIIAFADPAFRDYNDNMGDCFKEIDPAKLYLVTHHDLFFPALNEVPWSHIITWEERCITLLRDNGRTEDIDTWYPALEIVGEQEKNIVIATVRHAQDAHQTFKIFTNIHKDFDFRCYALAGRFLTSTAEGVDSFAKLQDTDFIDVLPKLPYQTFLKMLSKSAIYIELTPNSPIWAPAEALIHKAMVIRPEGKDEYLIGKNPLCIHNLNDEDELITIADNFKNIFATNECLSLMDEMCQVFDFQKQQEQLLKILHYENSIDSAATK